MLNSSALIDETLRFATESPSGVEVMAREGGAMLRVLVWPVLLYMLVNFLWTQYNMRGVPNDFNLPPGSFGLPLIGETIQFVANGRQFARSRLQSAGSAIFRTNLLLSPCVVVSGADNVRQVLFGEGRTVQHVGPPTGRLLFGPGALSNSSGETLQRHKKFIAKAFAFQELSAYTGAIHDVIRRQLITWCAEGGVKGVSECRRLTFMVTAHVLLGMRIDESDVGHIAQLFETFMTSFFAFPVALPGTAFSKGLEARKQLLVILRRYVDGAEEGSLLRRLADDINDIDVTCDICLEMLFGSYLTVASASCSTLLQLANNEHVRAKLREELSSLELGASSNGDSGKTLSWNDVSSLQYTSSVVKEIFRFMPPIAGGFRKTLQPFKLNGYDIPAGWLILYSIADTHETSSQVTDPMTFRPERWATSECCKSQSCDASSSSTGDNLGNQRSDYLPFGAGARKCVGQEFAKLVLKVFIAELTSSYDCDIKDLQPPMITAPVPFPANGLPLTLKRRCSDSSTKSSRTVRKSNGF